MIVILDSSILRQDMAFRRPSWEVLVQLSKAGNLTIAVPEVVIRETVRLFSEEVEKAGAKIRSGISDLKRVKVGIPEMSWPTGAVAQATADFDARLRATFERKGSEVLPIPDVPHEEVLGRIFEQRKPSKRKDDGYRDILIWNSARTLLLERDDDVVLITANHHDFALDEKSPDTLHPDLAKELAELAVGERLSIASSIDAFLEEHVDNADEQLGALTARIETDPLYQATLGGKVVAALDKQGSIGSEVTLEDTMLASGPFESPTLAVVDTATVRDVSVRQGLVTATSDLLVRVSASFEAELDVFIYKADFWSLGEEESRGLALLDADWNDHYVWCALQTDIEVEAETLVDSITLEIKDLAIINLRVV